MRTSLKSGDEWYALSYKWWQLWCEYAQFNDTPNERRESPGSESGDDAGMRPPAIDNSDLASGAREEGRVFACARLFYFLFNVLSYCSVIVIRFPLSFILFV